MRKNKTHPTIGPVQLLVLGFDPDTKFEGKIMKELERLDRVKTIRLLDLLFVKKDKKSNDLIALSIQQEKLGAIVGALMGFDFEDEKPETKKVDKDEENNAFGLSTEQIAQIGQSLEPGMAAGILLIEHMWARDLKQAVRDAGGYPVAEGFLTPEAITKVAAEIKAMTQIMDEMQDEDEQSHTGMRAYN